MDRRVALELLGLEVGEPVTHDRLRRAYLRRLRAHPPERDPDGFRRLREAFEQLETWARIQDQLRAMAAEHARSGAPAPDSDEPGRSGTSSREARGEPTEPAPAPAIVVALDAGERVEARRATRAHSMPLADRGSPGAHDTPDEPSRRPPGRPPVSAPIAGSPATLRDVMDLILALLQAGKLDAALEVADRWSRSTLDDHRAVDPGDAERWALTRELIDVAPVLPDSLRRAIARGIATGNLATACSEAETYLALKPEQANDLARHLRKRATSLYNVLASSLQSRAGLRDTPPQSARTSRGPIWAVVVIVAALVRAAGSCEHKPDPADVLDHMRELHLDGHAPSQFDRQQHPWLEPRLDAPTLDLRSHPPGGELGSSQRLELRPEGQVPPSQP